ncbi:hypothetical protein LOKVESSMR4R_03424 [Yoonia vestfoldensis]|uniref:Sel1 repeat protein n=1 Tax=Yoonia vestfoldensis TaxID=245188 RepID=A0A1Y0EGB9_9RHOB|nr:hypothetical protein LOKVESSMR4R_03424 [Yoonia vestfoldensis]
MTFFFRLPICFCRIATGSFCALLLITGTVLAAEGSDASPDPFDAAVDAVKAEEFGLANDLFFALAEQDDHDAQFNLAILLEAGKGTPQNYSLALEWAWLAQLGGVTRAQALADRLAEKLLPATKDMIASRIDSRLQDRLSKGDSAAIMQYVAFNQTILARPDLETAYIWTLIGAALNIAHAATTRNDIEGTLEPRVILAAQDTARMMFLDQDMALLFAETGVASR